MGFISSTKFDLGRDEVRRSSTKFRPRHLVPTIGHVVPKIGHVDPKVGNVDAKIGHMDSKIGYMDPKIGHVVSQIGKSVAKIGHTLKGSRVPGPCRTRVPGPGPRVPGSGTQDPDAGPGPRDPGPAAPRVVPIEEACVTCRTGFDIRCTPLFLLMNAPR